MLFPSYEELFKFVSLSFCGQCLMYKIGFQI
jgi:hypothetical protein